MRSAIAKAFETMATLAVVDRGPVPVVAGKGKTRVLRTETGRRVTLGQVLEAVALVAECEISVQEGRPKNVLCRTCKGLIVVAPQGGAIPDLCKRCRGAFCSGCGAPSAQGKPVKFCGACVKTRHDARVSCAACGGKKWGAGDKCNSCQVAARAAIKRTQTSRCSDCSALLGSNSRSVRCRSCACRVREADPERKRAASDRAKTQAASRSTKVRRPYVCS